MCIKDRQASSSTLSPERPVDVSTPKGLRQKGASKSPGTPSGALLQSPIRSPHGSTSQDVTPGRVSVTKKYAWMPSESESESEYKDGKKVRKKHANWTEEEKETMYRIANHFKWVLNSEILTRAQSNPVSAVVKNIHTFSKNKTGPQN